VAHTASISGSPIGLYEAVSNSYTEVDNPTLPGGGKILYNGIDNQVILTNLQSNTIYYIKVFTRNNNEWSDGVQILIGGIVWNGTNWSNGTGPTINDHALINGDFVSTDDLSASSLTIAPTGSFTISSGDTVTLEGAVINNATAADFVVENNANLIQNTNVVNAGDITVTRISAPIKRLDLTMWSSPVSGQNLKDFSPATLNNRFLEYDSANSTYVIIDPLSTNMTPAKGYAVRAPNNWSASVTSPFTGTFVGVPNNGNYSVSVAATGSRFYLIGNPYPSSLNIADFYNSGNNHIGATFYFYEHTVGITETGNNFATYNVLSDTFLSADRITSALPEQNFQGDIKAGQGFFTTNRPLFRQH
jgi:hypothetical protein